jgi:signal peptidase II
MNKGFQQLKRVVLILAILICCVGCDQTTKSLARDHLQSRATMSFLGDTLRLQYAENPGAFLSLGASLPHRWGTAAFTIGGIVVIAFTLVYALLASKPGRFQIAALSLICGGGIGNLVDRVRYDGLVTDFLNIGLGPIRTGIFNLADVALMVGVALLILRYSRDVHSEDAPRGA